MTCAKRYITLIELLIVLAILSIIMGVVGISIGTAVNTERFRASASMLVDKLRLAQDVMLILRTSVRVKLEQQPYGILCTVIAEEGLSPALTAATAKPVTIEGLQDFQFTDPDGRTSSGTVTLDFLSGGSRMSRGILVVSSDKISNNGASQATIYLPGYPNPINLGTLARKEAQNEAEYALNLADLYPKQVLAEERRRSEQNSQNNGQNPQATYPPS